MDQKFVRGIELNEPLFWNWDKIETLFEYMSRYNFNTVIFHQNDLLDKIVHFKKFHPHVLQDLKHKKKLNNIHYLRKVCRKAASININVFLEVKELSYEDPFLEAHPEVFIDKGIISPTHPIWKDYLTSKVEEALENVPGIDGIIVNVSAPESRLILSNSPGDDMEKKETSLQQDKDFKKLDLSDWYYQLLYAMYKPLKENNKTFVVREFAYGPEQQKIIMESISRLPEDTVISIKSTPHDFWPTFPDNPVIGQLQDRPQWIEYEVWGENHAWGVIPCYRVEEYQCRIKFQKSKGINGFYARINWETITQTWALDNLNEINLFGLNLMMGGEEQDPEKIFFRWMTERFALPGKYKYKTELHQLFRDTFHYVVGATYSLGHVFNRHCLLPLSYEQADWSFEGQDSIADVVPEKAKDLLTTRENLNRFIEEKREIIKMAGNMKKTSDKIISSEGLPFQLKEKLVFGFEGIELYAAAFGAAVRAFFAARLYLHGETGADIQELAFQGIADLKEISKQMEEFTSARPERPHYFYFFFDCSRPLLFAESIEKKIMIYINKEMEEVK